MPHRLPYALVLAVVALLPVQASRQSPDPQRSTAMRVFNEILNEGKFELASQFYATDFVNHTATRDIGLKEDQDAARGWRTAAPDLRVGVEKLLVDGEFVVALWRAEGTNTGTGGGLPATGKRLATRGITIWRIADGRIREEWSAFDAAGLLVQAGLLVPAPPK